MPCGTHAVARLFEDTWAMASQDLGTLNEQDCLNRMLIASSLRWAPLPPHLFSKRLRLLPPADRRLHVERAHRPYCRPAASTDAVGGAGPGAL